MNNKEIIFDENARKGLLNGITKLAKAVKSTLGAKGKNVLIQNGDLPPLVSKDGVTIAKNIKFADPIENMGASAIIEAASKTADNAGDGTTTTVVLAEAIYKEALKYLAAGHNPILLKRGIDRAVETIITTIKENSKPVISNEEIKQIAIVSTNWDKEIGTLVAEAIEKVTKDGVITIEESRTTETTIDIVEGMKYDRGYISPYFINNEETQKCEFEDAYILLHEKKLTNLSELLPILQLVAKSGKPLLIIAEDIENEVLSSLVINKLRGTLNVCAIKAPGFGERRKAFLDDIAVVTGGKVVEADLNTRVEDFTLEDLGVARKIIVTKNDVSIIEGKGDKMLVQARVNAVRNMIEEQTSDFEKEKYRERLAKLQGAVAIIKIGASTEPEMKEKRMRIDDAIAATRAAIEEGVSVGGSVALLRAYKPLECTIENTKADKVNETIIAGMNIVLNAIKSPLKCLCENAGLDSSIIIANVINGEGDYGYNVATEQYEHLLDTGVIDPTKVTRLTLQNAASVAGLLISSDCVIFDNSVTDDKI